MIRPTFHNFFPILLVALISSSTTLSLSARAAGADDPAGLDREIGEWTVQCKFYVDGPDAEPMLATGTETNVRIPGADWIKSDFQCEYAGVPFHGAALLGLDADTGKLAGVWVDNMSKTLVRMTGTYDPVAKTRVMRFRGRDLRNEPVEEKHVVRFHDDGTRTFAAYQAPLGAGEADFVKIMEMTYVKSKKN